MGETAEPAQVTESGWYRHLDLIATILLAVATVLTAWSAFQSSQWGGGQQDRRDEVEVAVPARLGDGCLGRCDLLGLDRVAHVGSVASDLRRRRP